MTENGGFFLSAENVPKLVVVMVDNSMNILKTTELYAFISIKLLLYHTNV